MLRTGIIPRSKHVVKMQLLKSEKLIWVYFPARMTNQTALQKDDLKDIPMSDQFASLATKLDLLFEYITLPDGKRFVYDDVVRLGGVDRGAISRLRSGKKLEPSFQTMVGLAGAFNVPLSYFGTEMTDDEVRRFLADFASNQDDKVLRRIETREQNRPNQEAEAIAMRAAYLDEEGRRTVAAMIDYVLKSQGVTVPWESEA